MTNIFGEILADLQKEISRCYSGLGQTEFVDMYKLGRLQGRLQGLEDAKAVVLAALKDEEDAD